MAVFMANSGGSWDNAKKYIEAGNHGGKGWTLTRPALSATRWAIRSRIPAVPANILIKLMSMVSVVVAGLVVRYSLLALGIF
ncbi:MAG: sodium/proton-translocating pyrophosphatase [Pirellulaceae bacterium]